MPASMTDTLEAALLDLVFCNIPFTPPASVHLGLLTALDAEADGMTFTEVSASGYARQPIAFNAPSNTLVNNSASLRFPDAPADWGRVTHGGLFTAATGGDLLMWLPFASPLDLRQGDVARIPAGSLTVQFAGAASVAIAQALLNRVLRGQGWTPVESVYVGVLASYTNDIAYAEPAGGGYTRRPVTFAQASIDGGVTRSINSAAVTFPIATADWPVVTHLALFDAPTAGRLLWRGTLASPRTVTVNRVLAFPPVSIDVRFD